MRNKILLTFGVFFFSGLIYMASISNIRKAVKAQEEKTVNTQYEKIPSNLCRYDIKKMVRTYGKTVYHVGDDVVEYPYVGTTTKVIKDVPKGGQCWIQVRTFYVINAEQVDWSRTSETGEPKYEVDVHLTEDFQIDRTYPNSDPRMLEQLDEMHRKIEENEKNSNRK